MGYGLYANLREMYQALAKYHNPGKDLVFLFGFSRGAFTVRALAGLIYRCGIPTRRFAEDDEAFACCFSQAYAAYKPHCENWVLIDKFRKTYEAVDAEVHFLGIWDTVKSYGGLRPQSLPHLRHNPIVRNVCHALALDERRSWFLATRLGRHRHRREKCFNSEGGSAISVSADEGGLVHRLSFRYWRRREGS